MWTFWKEILLALILSKLHQIRNIFSTGCLLMKGLPLVPSPAEPLVYGQWSVYKNSWNSQCSQISENVYHSITLIFTRPNFSSQEMVPPLMTWDVVLTWLLINQKISKKLFLKKTSLIAALKRKTFQLNFHRAKLLTSRNGSSSNGMGCRVDLIIY